MKMVEGRLVFRIIRVVDQTFILITSNMLKSSLSPFRGHTDEYVDTDWPSVIHMKNKDGIRLFKLMRDNDQTFISLSTK